MKTQSPNTTFEREDLSESVILCCGEDEGALLRALTACSISLPPTVKSFRSYRLWKINDLTVILSPIGTGSLEPLLFEILQHDVIRKLVLIGTAGLMADSKAELGIVYPISKALLSGTGLDREIEGAVKPRFPVLDYSGDVSIISTDFYYGFSANPVSAVYRAKLKHLGADFKQMKADLVDMETAQFYALCKLLDEKGTLQYVSFKGAANTLVDQSDQNTKTDDVLILALGAALEAVSSDVSVYLKSPLDG